MASGFASGSNGSNATNAGANVRGQGFTAAGVLIGELPNNPPYNEVNGWLINHSVRRYPSLEIMGDATDNALLLFARSRDRANLLGDLPKPIHRSDIHGVVRDRR